MTTYFGSENNIKTTERSPDYLIYRTKEEMSDEKRTVGIIYRVTSKKGVEYLNLKVMANGNLGDPEDKKTYLGFRNSYGRTENDPKWLLYLPSEVSKNEKLKKVGNVFECVDEGGKMYFRITFFDGDDGQKGKGIEPNKSNL